MLKLRILRKECNLSQKELAQKLGVSQSNIYNYEMGRTEPSIEILCKLANVLDVTVDYLVGNSDELGNVGTTEQFTEEEIDLVRCYRAIGKAERLALITTAKSFYSQIKEKSGSHAT